MARAGNDPAAGPPAAAPGNDYDQLAERLRLSRTAADEETRLANPQADVEAIVQLIDGAPKLFVYGLGDDGLYAREFAMRLSLLGMLTVHHADPILMMANLSAARPGDVLLVFSEFGKLPQLFQLSRQFGTWAARWCRSPGTAPTRCARTPMARWWCARTTRRRTWRNCCTVLPCSRCWTSCSCCSATPTRTATASSG